MCAWIILLLILAGRCNCIGECDNRFDNRCDNRCDDNCNSNNCFERSCSNNNNCSDNCFNDARDDKGSCGRPSAWNDFPVVGRSNNDNNCQCGCD